MKTFTLLFAFLGASFLMSSCNKQTVIEDVWDEEKEVFDPVWKGSTDLENNTLHYTIDNGEVQTLKLVEDENADFQFTPNLYKAPGYHQLYIIIEGQTYSIDWNEESNYRNRKIPLGTYNLANSHWGWDVPENPLWEARPMGSVQVLESSIEWYGNNYARSKVNIKLSFHLKIKVRNKNTPHIVEQRRELKGILVFYGDEKFVIVGVL